MQVDDIVKYLPTLTVGKVTGIREQDGRSWVRLDFTGLWYDASLLTPCDASEYKPVSVKYREVKEVDLQSAIDAMKKEDVDIGGFSPTA
ncbi:MAG: DUF2098 domain-containing protein [Candidatus Methanomethylophilaceae archaeon]|jgi:hypothetical protein|nr:DUF2098 domain-containing protein [Candidatus Methanomethylophilaceae archaeon]MBO5669414.1 DUF2098 domain-containing protein [Candidatus Methanomethylophilaceae archaeon]